MDPENEIPIADKIREAIERRKMEQPKHRRTPPLLFRLYYRQVGSGPKTYWQLSNDEAEAWNLIQDYHERELRMPHEAIEHLGETSKKIMKQLVVGFFSGGVFTSVMFGIFFSVC